VVKKLHAKHGNDPADDLNDNDAHHDGHAATIDGGQHLATDNGINRTVAELVPVSKVDYVETEGAPYHKNDVQGSWDFSRPVSHEIAQHDLETFP
jgi:hypothetical protein